MILMNHAMMGAAGYVAAGGDWTPESITTAMWLDAADSSTITLSGDDVELWSDKSGSGRDVEQGSAAARPLHVASGLNGKGVIEFDGVNEFLRTNSTQLHTGAWSVFAISRSHTISAGALSVFSQDRSIVTTRNRIAQYLRMNGSNAESISFTTTEAAFVASATVDSLAWSVRCATLSSSQLHAYWNGASIASAAVSGTNATGTIPAVVGAREPELSIFVEFFNGEIAEILFINGAVDETTRQTIEGYLAHKWGLELSLPSDHPYKSSAP